ncbi:MAG: DNA mismatch repair protein MutL [Chloroflexi bacterium]|jgi:DNA mismatch repair protein MutL|nr:MAG: DNA mismatch repair protein MutL [Chloroflexota bacterium]
MKIHVLAEEVASKIAAGEVVERPVSVVKELIENSIDAEATRIIVEIIDGGTKSIRVSDNGTGIPVDELEIALERHATSKITKETELEHLHTMGFRGEALPSIGAVSRLVITSTASGYPQGGFVETVYGKKGKRGAAASREGTSVLVEDLFSNVPARKKFLKSTSAETARINAMVNKLALAHPEVGFTLVSNGTEKFNSNGSGDLKEIMSSTYDSQTVDSLIPVEGERSKGSRLSGYVSSPSITRANRSAINIFVNKRWVESRILSQAVDDSYKGLLMKHRHPIAVLHLEIPPSEVDVNVHPAKREVRFRNEGFVFSLIIRTIRELLISYSPVPLITPDLSLGFASQAQPRVGDNATINRNQPSGDYYFNAEYRHTDEIKPTNDSGIKSEFGLFPKQILPTLRVIGQASQTYVIAEGPSGIFLIDQHAAHERTNYEAILKKFEAEKPDTQLLLEPLVLDLSPEQIETLDQFHATLLGHGFQIEPFGERSYLARGFPSGVSRIDPETLLIEILRMLKQTNSYSQAFESLAASIACHSSIKAGDTITHDEMTSLIRKLEQSKSPNTCPHGRPTMIELTTVQLEHRFGRR